MGYSADKTEKEAPQPEGGVPKALKFAVIGMGVALIGGLLLLMVLVVGKIAGGRDKNAAQSCRNVAIVVKGEGRMTRVTEEGNHLALRLRRPDGTLVLRRYHLCNGELLREIRIQRP